MKFNLNYNNKIILSLVIFIIASFSYLAYTEQNQENYLYHKNWWTVYFVSPQLNDLTFAVENYSSSKNFHYTILDGNNKVLENDVVINKSDKRVLNINSDVAKIESNKLTIEVTDGKNKKEIYRNY